MYIDLDTVIRAASVISSIGVIIGVIVAVYKVFQINRKQSDFIKSIEDEQTLLCYGLKGALQGLIEQGCNGPCKDALDKLEKHLNKRPTKRTTSNRRKAMNITEIATAILPSVMEIIGTIAMLMAAKIGIPWLREQRIFSLVRKLVKGAEKAAEAGKIPKTDKHALVIKLLKMKNIEVTPFLDAFIDAAIKEMDEVAENIADEITKD